MNDKITFPRLSTLLADRSGRSKRFSEDFLREFFALISENLEAGDSVKIKGLGTFRLSRVEPRKSIDVTTGLPMEISGHSKVVFVPAKELAEAVNAPFEAFSAIEISDDADVSQLFTKDEIALQANDDSEEETSAYEETDYHEQQYQPATIAEALPPQMATTDEQKEEDGTNVILTAADEEPSEEIEAIDAPEATFFEEATDEEATDEEASDEEATDEEATDEEATDEEVSDNIEAYEENEGIEAEEDEFDPPTDQRRTWVRTLMISLGAAVFALVATFIIWYVFATNDFNGLFNGKSHVAQTPPQQGFVVGEQPTPTPTVAIDTIEDSIEAAEGLASAEEPEVPTAPSDAIVYDTISTTRYLTTMAKTHYGNYNLWPFIYEENKAFLGHPDRIRPGTPVVIPKLSKFGIDPTNASDIEKAKRMGVEIYSRYGKKI